MSDEKIKTKKKEKSTWGTIGSAVLGVAGLAVTLSKVLGRSNKS